MAEQGFPNFESSVWWALSAQKGVPEPIIQKINGALQKIMVSNEVKEAYLKLGITPLYSAPERVNEIVRRDSPAAGEQIKKLNLAKD
jgi:tripartite-type tricarboxylate transporter receptor subunit TctC